MHFIENNHELNHKIRNKQILRQDCNYSPKHHSCIQLQRKRCLVLALYAWASHRSQRHRWCVCAANCKSHKHLIFIQATDGSDEKYLNAASPFANIRAHTVLKVWKMLNLNVFRVKKCLIFNLIWRYFNHVTVSFFSAIPASNTSCCVFLFTGFILPTQ